MTRPARLLAWSALIVAVVVGWLAMRPGGERVALDLVSALPDAERRPSPDAFSVVDTSLGGVSHQAILVTQPSRLTFHVADVPDGAWLRLYIGQREDSWQIEGDGTLFQVGVSDGQQFEELFSLVVNPYRNESDRGWHELVLDLDEYAGRSVDVILNTRSGPPDPPAEDTRGDFALWGAPRIVAR
jgi:hypothetical protein